jgi:hypothetical protein
LVFLGTPDVAATTLQTIVEYSLQQQQQQQQDVTNHQHSIPLFEVVAVVTQPARRAKRTLEGDATIQTPVGKVAQHYQIPILCPDKVSLHTLYVYSMCIFRCICFIPVRPWSVMKEFIKVFFRLFLYVLLLYRQRM